MAAGLGEKVNLAKGPSLYSHSAERSNVTRFMLVLLSHSFARQDALANVTPKTFIGWHRAGFRLFWRWKSRPGRPPISIERRRLIREMALSNPSWGEERIANELLLKLGIRYPTTKVPHERHRCLPRWALVAFAPGRCLLSSAEVVGKAAC